MVLEEPSMDDFITQQSPVAFDPKAECPEFDDFLWWLTGENQELAQYIQVAMGYSLTGLTSEQCLFFCHGSGANGKSTLLDTFKYILGDYARTIPSDDLMSAGFNSSLESTLARIKGARAVFCSETSNKMMNETAIKELTAGEVIQARMKYGHPFEFRPVAKLWIAGNHKPSIVGTDLGIWRRIRLVPFEQTVSAEKRDTRLLGKLIAEAPGILLFALNGLKVFHDDLGSKLPICEAVSGGTESYREEMDVLGQFIEEACDTQSHKEVASSKLFSYYRRWAIANGYSPLNQKNFSIRIAERGYECKRTMKSRDWQGIGLTTEVVMGDAWWLKD
jgi:putative DNA primase/helicase